MRSSNHGRLRRPLWSALALGTVSALFLAGCSTAGPSTAEPESGEANDPIVWGIRDYFEPQAVELIAAYEEAFPGSSVELRLFPSDEEGYLQAVLATKIADDVPDVLAHWNVVASTLAEAEITEDMTSLTEGEGALDFAEAFIGEYQVRSGELEGEIHGFPQGADAVVLYYNKTHFDEAGLDVPDDTWTWDDLMAAAEALTVTDAGGTSRWGLTAPYDWAALWNPMIISEGSTALSSDGLEAQLDTPEAIATFTKLTQPVVDGYFVPPSVMADMGGEQGPFWNGSASMLFSVRALVPGTRDSMTDDWDVAPFPLVNGERNVGGGSVGVAWTTTANQAAAEQFLRWYFSEEGGMGILATTYSIVPPVESLFDSPIWRDLPGPPSNNDVFVEAIENSVLSPNIAKANQGPFYDAIADAYDKIILGGISVEDAMREADAAATEALQQ